MVRNLLIFQVTQTDFRRQVRAGTALDGWCTPSKHVPEVDRHGNVLGSDGELGFVECRFASHLRIVAKAPSLLGNTKKVRVELAVVVFVLEDAQRIRSRLHVAKSA